MFTDGQQVEITGGPFATASGVVISPEEALRRGYRELDDPVPEEVVWVMLTFWGHEIPVTLTPDEIRTV